MGNINITSLKRTGYKRKGGDDKNAIKNDNIQNDYDKKSIISEDMDDCLDKLIAHTKNYNVENSLIIIPEKILNHQESNIINDNVKDSTKYINEEVSNEDIIHNYKIMHINNVEINDAHNQLIKSIVNEKKIKNVLITNMLVNHNSGDNDTLNNENKKVLKILRRHKKKQKSTDMYLDHYCSLLKNIIINLEYKWDWYDKSLMSDLSHQLKTPLTGLLTGIQILSKKKTSKSNADIIEHLFKSCLELSSHINNITDYYFINQNNIKLNYTIIHVKTILLNIKKIYKTQLYDTKNRFIYSIDDMSNKIIMQDKDRLFKVLYNLVNNSIKFTSKGYIYINIFISEDNKRYYFRIYDTGQKVEDEDKEYLFDPFYRFDERKEHVFREGIGLGLSICKKIINAMKGSIYFINCDDISVSKLIPNIKTNKKFVNCIEYWFPMSVNEESNINKLDNIIDMMDTTIHTLNEFDEDNNNNNNNNNTNNNNTDNTDNIDDMICDVDIDLGIDIIKKKNLNPKIKRKKRRKLPQIPNSSDCGTILTNHDDTCSIESNDNIQLDNDFSKCNKILIVEDHKANSSLIRLMIQNILSSSIQVDIQNSSEFAYDDIINGDYDYVLLDLRMPKVSGFDILNKLKKKNYFKRTKKSKIIVFTALLSNIVEDLKIKYSDIDIIYKPIDIKQLASKLSS
jgi:CheY-like chemotaxis protein